MGIQTVLMAKPVLRGYQDGSRFRWNAVLSHVPRKGPSLVQQKKMFNLLCCPYMGTWCPLDLWTCHPSSLWWRGLRRLTRNSRCFIQPDRQSSSLANLDQGVLHLGLYSNNSKLHQQRLSTFEREICIQKSSNWRCVCVFILSYSGSVLITRYQSLDLSAR
jgi:hypothetical protein